MRLGIYILACYLGYSSQVLAQAAYPTPALTARYLEAPIQLDGVLDEEVWQPGGGGGDFYQFFPSDTAHARYGTEMRVAYDETTLYVAVRAEAEHGDFVVSSLQRDFSGTANDNVAFFFDTFSDGANAFAFGITPFGVRREFLVSNGGATRNDYNFTWDVKWRGEARRYDDHFTAEMAIPFTSLKFPEGSDVWRFRGYRFNVQSGETSTWARVPQSQLLGNLAFMGELRFERPLGRSRTPLALIPYVATEAQRDFLVEDGGDTGLSVGGDAKVALGDGLNLDLTVNPDFSQVEVDAIFTNLTRFDIRLPEQRQFFIDNADIFGSLGDYFGTFQPFFSRRIGLAADTAGNLIENRIIAGARLSGKLTDKLRLGVLNVQTAADEGNGITSDNSTAVVLQRRVGARSTANAFVINRQTFGGGSTEGAVLETERYNRVVGAEYFLASADGTWNGKAFVHQSLDPEASDRGTSAQTVLAYNRRDWVALLDVAYVGADFTSDLGFVPRKDFVRTGLRVQRFLYPRNRAVLNRYSFDGLLLNFHRPGLDYRYTDFVRRLTTALDFTNQATASLQVAHNFIYLAEDFDPTRTADAVPLPGDVDYKFWDVEANFESSPRGLFTYEGTVSGGQFYNGSRASAEVAFGYRFQPWVSLGLAARYDGLRLPDPHADADLYLLSPRMEVTFSRKLFWTTLMQYASQRDALGINSRLQWRYAPLSDLFLVYNDGYSTGSTWAPRFRSVNLKLSYWLNL